MLAACTVVMVVMPRLHYEQLVLQRRFFILSCVPIHCVLRGCLKGCLSLATLASIYIT